MDHSTVTAKLIEKFGKKPKPEEELEKAIKAKLDPNDLPGSLTQFYYPNETVRFNDAASLGLLRNSVAKSRNVHYVMFRGPIDYEMLKKAISYCHQKGHRASRCPHKTYRDTRYSTFCR